MEKGQRIGFIGLGRMGRPMAENLLRKGFSLTIFARKKQVQEEMKALGAEIAPSPAELAKRCEVIIFVVSNPKAVGRLIFKDGIGRTASRGTILVDMTVSDPRISRGYAKRLEKRGIEYLDAPMSGGALGAREAQLLFMVGGKQEVYEQCLPLFNAMGKKTLYMGEIGNAHLIKLVHNQASIAIYVATCEALVLGESLGLPLERMIEVFNLGNARSYASEVRFPRFILPKTYNMGSTYANQYKDLSIIRRVGKRAKVKTPITDCAWRMYKHGMENGRGEEDFSKIILDMKEILRRGASRESR
jgi:3-hydroxyisobutyrate dehydrogenase-like beta-hydroxyacid dehydrogenase